jgi:ketosteroid isomerase-like protein
MNTKYFVLVVGILLAACNGATDSSTAVMSAAEVGVWQAEALAFNERNLGSWPDLDLSMPEFAEDATVSGPSGGFFIEGKRSISHFFEWWTLGNFQVEIETKRVFVSADSAAFDNIWHNLWPYWADEPPDHPPLKFLDRFQFQDGLVTSYIIFDLADNHVITEAGCFPVDGCPELREIVDRYLAAWSSRDEGQIAALYTEDAVFTDSLLGMEVEGSGAIAALADQRFGSIGDTPLEYIELYAQIDGRYPPTEEEPENGRIVGVGILYQWNALAGGKSSAVESITTFEVNPQGLITREEVFHDPDSLIAAGLAQ